MSKEYNELNRIKNIIEDRCQLAKVKVRVDSFETFGHEVNIMYIEEGKGLVIMTLGEPGQLKAKGYLDSRELFKTEGEESAVLNIIVKYLYSEEGKI
ncbi:MAG: hypothetical protein GY782_04600 [Gammaproteobacteria bacterium]|nr:hypothetical protein [Gammaproteobacteria bacterium]